MQEDLKLTDDLLETICKEPDLIDIWKYLEKSPSLRKDVNSLKAYQQVFKSQSWNAGEFEELTSILTSSKEQSIILDELEQAVKAGGSTKASLLEIAKWTGKYITRTLDAATDLKIIDRVKTLRQKLTSDYKRSGNFGWAETEVSGLSKSEYYAHSGIDEFSGTLPERVPDISLKPQTEIFPWSIVPNSVGYPIARNIDTEYKILTEIAQRLESNTNATGKIILFTERAPCSSCSNVIQLFSKKYRKIHLEVVHNNGVLLTNF